VACGQDALVPTGLDGNPDPIRSPARDAVIDGVAAAVGDVVGPDACALVGIDGIDGAGKSTFADELAVVLRARGTPVVRSTTDAFHNPRSVRWARGKGSPDGFYLDSHDLPTLRRVLLDPLSASPPQPYRAAAFDEPTDAAVDAPEEVPVPGSVLVFDGLFLQRPELRSYWHLLVWLDGQRRVDDRRVVWAADGGPPGLGALPHLLGWWSRLARYHEGMLRYVQECDPIAGADVVVANDDLASPRIVRREPRRSGQDRPGPVEDRSDR
jgi:uridine kinase